MFNTPEGSKLAKYGGIVLIALTIFLGVQTIYTLMSTAKLEEDQFYPSKTISVNGTGEKLAIPDVATFSFGAQLVGETVASAQQVVTEKINKAIDLIKAAGVDEKDIKTTGYNIYPNYTYTQRVCTSFSCTEGRQVLTGYNVSQTVEVKVRDTSKAGDLLQKLGSLEVTDLSGLNFTVDDEEKIRAEAQSMAIADAREKAKVLAKDLGVRLGHIVSFSEGYYPQPYYEGGYAKGGDMVMNDSVAPAIPVGENKFVSNVSVVYEIK